jgi:hypothetical protein
MQDPMYHYQLKANNHPAGRVDSWSRKRILSIHGGGTKAQAPNHAYRRKEQANYGFNTPSPQWSDR